MTLLRAFEIALDNLEQYKDSEDVDWLQMAIDDLKLIQERTGNPELFAGALEYIQDHKDTECMEMLALAIEDIQNIQKLAIGFIKYRP